MIKEFRSWDYYLQRFEYWTINDLCNKNLSPSAIEEWTQWTGLYDCNGVKIFEGDIIEFDRKEWGGDDNIHLVSWDNKEGRWSWGGGSTSDMEFRKVIGNIYANPELLEESNNE